MAINWVLECQPVAARGYVCGTQEEAESKCENKAEYDACLRVTLVHRSVATITLAKIDRSVRLSRGDLLRLAIALHRRGINDAYFERQLGRQSGCGEFATLVESGPLAGMYHVDIAAMAGGAGGSY